LWAFYPLLSPLVGILAYFAPSNDRLTRQKDRWMVVGMALCGCYLLLLALALLFGLFEQVFPPRCRPKLDDTCHQPWAR
jgi:RsiW-degrading membrane proteinase PrsW (M82 family)